MRIALAMAIDEKVVVEGVEPSETAIAAALEGDGEMRAHIDTRALR